MALRPAATFRCPVALGTWDRSPVLFILIVDQEPLGRALAGELVARGHEVSYLDDNEEYCRQVSIELGCLVTLGETINLLLGGLVITELAPDLGLDEAFSTVFTAIGVFGPSFAPVARLIALPVLAKAIFILGMLVGRLEILPLLVFLNPRAWTR